MLLLAFNFNLPLLRSRILRYAYISLCLQSNPETSPLSLTLLLYHIYPEKATVLENFHVFTVKIEEICDFSADFHSRPRHASAPGRYCRFVNSLLQGRTNFYRFLIPSRETPAPLNAFLLIEPKGRNLIDVIVQPVGKEQVGG